MTDLQKALREAVAFDENRSVIENVYEKDRHRYLSKNGIGLFGCGAVAENERLLPILAALEGCVEALGFYGDKNNWNRDEGGWRHDMIESDLDDESLTKWDERFSGKRARDALERLRKALEK